MIEGISAITLATHDMRRAVRFYRVLGFAMLHGGEDEGFTSFKAGSNFVNLIAQPAARQWSWWGRVIFYHSDVDGLYARLIAAGYPIEAPPRDAELGERFFPASASQQPRPPFGPPLLLARAKGDETGRYHH
jgi:catechol 2,3-dioxygenase-like lactoylglutathione lyase family enzyme